MEAFHDTEDTYEFMCGINFRARCTLCVDRIVVINVSRLRHPLPESSNERIEEEKDDTRPSPMRRKWRWSEDVPRRDSYLSERPVSKSQLVENSALCEVADPGDEIVVNQHCQGGQGDSVVPVRGCPSSGA